jgi:hypothetical protein
MIYIMRIARPLHYLTLRLGRKPTPRELHDYRRILDNEARAGVFLGNDSLQVCTQAEDAFWQYCCGWHFCGPLMPNPLRRRWRMASAQMCTC